MPSLSEPLLQRLVDSELTHEERQTFLTAVNESPELWRDVALAFVEHQVLEQDLPIIFPPSPPTVAQPIAMQRRRPMWPVAIAALLMLSLGFFAGRVRQHNPAGSKAIADTQLVSNTLDPPYRLRFATVSHAGTSQTVEVPVYEQAQLISPSQQTRNDLSDRGYAVDWSTDYLTGRLQDGRQLIVPVVSPAIHYYGQ